MAKTISNLMVVIGANVTQLEKSLNKTQRNLGKFGRNMNRTGDAFTKGLTLPILAAGGAALKAYGDFEQAMVNSTAIMGDLSQEMRHEMETTAREVAKTTKFSAAEAAESYFFLASAGLDAEQSMAALPRVAKFAQAGNFDMARATDLLTDAQSALGLSVDDTAENMENMVRVSDVLVKANTLSNATVEEFSEALTNKGAQALSIMNKEIEEGVAILSVFADQGLKGSEAGTILARTIEGLEQRARLSRGHFEKLGISIFDTEGEMRNIADIVGDMESAFHGLTTEQVNAELAQLGFNERSRRGILTLLGNSEALRDYEEDLKSAGGVTEEVADKQMEGLWAQLGLLKDRLIDTQITLGETLAPTITDVVMPAADGLIEKIEEIAQNFADLEPEQQKVILKNILLAAAIGPVLKIIGGLAFAVSHIIGLFKILGGAKVLGWVIGLIKTLGAVALSSAAFMGVAGLAGGLIVAKYHVEKAIEGFKELIDIWRDTRAEGGGIGDFLENLVESIVNHWIRDLNRMIDFINKVPGVNIGKIEERSRTYDEPKATKTVPDAVRYGGAFDSGGTVPGPLGSPQMILAHGGETVLPTHKSGNEIKHSGTITVRGVNSQGELTAVVDVVMDKLAESISSGNRRIPNRSSLVPG